MAVPMHSTTSPGSKIYPERPIPGGGAKSSTMASTAQKPPSRSSSAAPNVKEQKEISKTPLGGEDLLNIKNTEPGPSLPSDNLRTTPVHPAMAIQTEPGNTLNPAMRGAPGANTNHAFIPNPYFTPGINLNVASQQGYGPSPQMQFYAPSFNPNTYAQAGAARPGSAIPKFQNMDPKFPPGPAHSNAPPQIPNNMARRPSSNYFVPPTMSPVQTSYGIQPRGGWIPGTPTMLPGPMAIQNGNTAMQSPAMYQPAMLPGNANPALLTPPGAVQPNYSNPFPPPSAPNPAFGYPTPPETTAGGVVPTDIPPPVPSIYPDPTYSNINNCIYNPKGTTNVYIRGLRPETSDEDLFSMVGNYGTIISTKAIIDTQTKLCKG
jgi:hypothetical protein